MHKSRLAALVIDCGSGDMDRHADFWSAALGYAAKPAEPGFEAYREFAVPGDDVQVLLQKVDHPSRVHLDIETDNLEAEVARLERLGAREVSRVRDWCVMQAPSGHRFCIVKPQRSDFDRGARTWPD